MQVENSQQHWQALHDLTPSPANAPTWLFLPLDAPGHTLHTLVRCSCPPSSKPCRGGLLPRLLVWFPNGITRAQWHSWVIPAPNQQSCCCCYCLCSHQPPACSRAATDTLATRRMHLAAGTPPFLLQFQQQQSSLGQHLLLAVMATALLPWGLLTHLLSVCTASSFTHQCSAGRVGSLFLKFGFHSAAQHSRTCARTCVWNSTLGLDPKLPFVLREESHPFQGSLDHTILCQ